MDEEKQRIKIAEACGWRFNKISKFICGETFEVVSPDLKRSYGWSETYKTIDSRSGVDVAEFVYQTLEQVLKHASIPNYPEDLNAMADAVAYLTPEQIDTFAIELSAIVLENPSKTWWNLNPNEVGHVITATAAQQAEAFLKTLGLWEE